MFLMRLHKSVGTIDFFFPDLYGDTFAANVLDYIPIPGHVEAILCPNACLHSYHNVANTFRERFLADKNL